MKIDKKSPSHWICLIRFGLNVACASVWRIFRRRRSTPQIVLYGHKLAGNLLALYRYLDAPDQTDFHVSFLTLDKNYHRQLLADGVRSVLATSVQGATLLSYADAVVSDHGLHAMSALLRFSDLKFFDVWHGVPFKGFDADDFGVQHRYDECWVPSALMAKMYVERYGFDATKVKTTGYARTDRLVHRNENIGAIKRALELAGPDVGKIVLFAPTWKQHSKQRSLFPFGIDEQEFYRSLSKLGERSGATFVMRAHLNSNVNAHDVGVWPHIVHLPHAIYPDTEAILLVSDILVCDWSSIAFDFLLLQRPTLFLDVEAPFAKGFSLGPEYRFGEIVPDMDKLLLALGRYLLHPSEYQAKFGARAAQIRQAVYGDYADGAAAARCVDRLHQQLMPTHQA